ncbi:MAG: cell surface protein SprA [Candidatus Cloacimonetes bacterium]|nr:cell surface protein SprA [Candidatus Cloacimonadota bacterium]MBL7085927.1 cell surface protein SprA [Candidatus Cloacimonadota bacterium]
MNKRTVTLISSIVITLLIYLIIQISSIKAETISTSETLLDQSELLIDSLQQNDVDTILSIVDTLEFIGDTLSIIDTLILFEKEVEEEEVFKEDSLIFIDTTFYAYAPYLLKMQLSHPLISSSDSSTVFSYLISKSFPKKSLDYYFFKDNLYSYSEEIDLENEVAFIKVKYGGTELFTPFMLNMDDYLEIKSRCKFYEIFYNELDRFYSQQAKKQESQGIIPDIEFPKVKMSKTMRRFFGDNIGRLKVNGTQRITIGGSRTVNKPELETESSHKSFLPDLKMEQKLNLGINGTIGKKIKVDVKQTSEVSIFEENKISIKYEGDEDDPIKLIEAGDTRISLSGSQFIGYSASSEDLFGIKGVFEFGKLNLTTIMSQQEGKQASASATGNAVQEESEYMDMNFARNKYFFIDNPKYLFSADGDIDTVLISEWSYIDTDLMPQDGSVRVFVDDGKVDPNDITGYDIEDGKEYKFHELNDPINDFFIDYFTTPYLIKFGTYIGNNYAIGIIYTDRIGREYGSFDDTLKVKMIKKNYYNVSDEDLDDALWNYQLKNKYSLGNRNIESQGFDVKIFYYLPNGEKVFGLDVDSTTFIPFVDILNLDTNGDGIVNDRDETIDLVNGVITFQMLKPFLEHWFAKYDSTLGNNIIYNKLSPDPAYYDPFYISVIMKKTGSTINLGYINIIKNSERVYVDGILQKKGPDYDIDYLSGTVRLKCDVTTDTDIKIDFEYEPFFGGLEKKSMFGVRADYKFNNNTKIGATIMYESGSVRDQRPKVGNEPKKTLVGDIDGSFKMDMPFLTNLVDKIPLIKTQETSNITLSGEVAMNIPNPNASKNAEAYIDDMEGIDEKYSLGISRTDWTFASIPLDIDTLVSRGDFIWYNPYHIFQQKDIYPDLPEDEGREYVSALEFTLKSDTLLFPESEPPIWGGIMKAFGYTAEDFSKKKYLELILKSNANEGDSLFIDLGFISEDYYPILDPNGILDVEDVNQDGELDIGEDSGLDLVIKKDPPIPENHTHDGDSIGIRDDGNDDYNYSAGSNVYSGINGTEGNSKLDGEDLDRNYRLDVKNNYLQYHIDLKNIDSEILISEYNNWKFIRIPLQDSTYFTQEGVGNVNFSLIKNARIWSKTTTSDPLTVDIVTCEVVGNKWKASAILDTALQKVEPVVGEEFEIATENNRENIDYTPPPGSIEEDKREKPFEQSLFLKCTNIQQNRYIYARENFIDGINLLLYNKVKFWVYGQTNSMESGEEIIIFRLGADTSNYYEYRDKICVYNDINDKMKEERWQDITIDFTEFTDLKKTNMADTTKNFRVVGNPSLGYIKQIAVGLVRPDSCSTSFTGKIFFDDIRVADPYDEMGFASRITLNTKLADLADIRINFENKTPNFYSLGPGGGSGANSYSYSLKNTINLHKFFPSSWGFSVPLRLDYSFSESKPRFQPNSDVALTTEAEKDLFKSLSETKYTSISLKKSKPSSNPIAKYLLDKTSVVASLSRKESLSPTKKDTTLKYSGNFKYNLDFSKDSCVDIFKVFKIYYLPQNISFNLGYNYNRFEIWSRQSGIGKNFIKEKRIPTETATSKLTMNYEIFSYIKTDYSLNTTRDLQKKNKLKGINIGVETSKNQNFTLNYSPNFLKFINYSSRYKTNYLQNRKDRIENDSTLVEYDVENSRTASGGLTLYFEKWGNNIMDLIKVQKFEKDEKEISEYIQEGLPLEDTGNDTIAVDDTLEVEKLQTEEIETKPPKSFNLSRLASYTTKAIGFCIKLLGSTTCNYSNTYRTRYYVPSDSLPSFSYQFGFRDLQYGNIQSSGQADEITLSTKNQFDIFSFLSADFNAKYNRKLEQNSGSKTKNVGITLPGFSLRYNKLDEIIPWNITSNSSVSSSFTRSTTDAGSGFWDKPDRTTIKYQFNPLVSFSTKLFNKVTSSISCNYSLTHTENYIENKNQSKTGNIGLNLSLKYSFQSKKGIKLPFLKRFTISNKLDTDLDISYRKEHTQNKSSASAEWIFTANTNTFEIKPRISYNFSRDINGGLTGGYKNTTNKKTGKSTRTTELNIWVEFKF